MTKFVGLGAYFCVVIVKLYWLSGDLVEEIWAIVGVNGYNHVVVTYC